jgi:hypothetical protein
MNVELFEATRATGQYGSKQCSGDIWSSTCSVAPIMWLRGYDEVNRRVELKLYMGRTETVVTAEIGGTSGSTLTIEDEYTDDPHTYFHTEEWNEESATVNLEWHADDLVTFTIENAKMVPARDAYLETVGTFRVNASGAINITRYQLD